MSKRKRIDYDRIEAGWRAGLLSPRQLAAQYTEDTGETVSHAAIINHFKKQGVPRDLSAKIRAKSDAMVTAAMVTEQVTPETVTRDREIVDSGAEALKTVRLTQRKDVQRSRRIAMALMPWGRSSRWPTSLGAVDVGYRYDPWDRPRDGRSQALNEAQWRGLERLEKGAEAGFTGHGMLDEVGLIHMGGRLYDPTAQR
ncbi:hypothetical protein ACEK07_04875 [Alcanivoracaceae bacterium MT1]